jgi:hypothetical protein
MRRVRRKTKNLAAGASVALATAGLSHCNDNGAVDPPPPPLSCNTVDEGETLAASGTLSGTALQVTIRNSSPSSWTAVEVTSVRGGTLAAPPTAREPLEFTLTLADAGVTSGGFTLRGTLTGFGNACTVARTFNFTVSGTGVTIARAGELPLPARQQARIALVSREGTEVELLAATPFRGPQTISWFVSAGTVIRRDGARLRWRLPQEPGFYQAELVIDYGPDGLSLDTLALEVG